MLKEEKRIHLCLRMVEGCMDDCFRDAYGLGLKTNMFSYSSGGLKLKIKILTGLDGKWLSYLHCFLCFILFL